MARNAQVFNQPEPNGEDGSENIQPNGIEMLFGPTQPEDQREFMNDDGDGKSDENKKASVPQSAKERTTMSTSKYDLAKKVAVIFAKVQAVTSAGLDKLADKLEKILTMQAESESNAQVIKEEYYDNRVRNDEFTALINDDPELVSLYQGSDSSIRIIQQIAKNLENRIGAGLVDHPELNGRIREFINTLKSTNYSEINADIDKRIAALHKKLESAEKEKEEASKLPKNYVKYDYTLKFEKFYNRVKGIAKSDAEIRLDKEKSREKKSPKPASPPHAKTIAPDGNPGGINNLLKKFKNKDPEEKNRQTSTWLNPTNVVASASDFASVLSDIKDLWEEYADEVESIIDATESADAATDEALSLAEELIEELASSPTDEAGEEAMDKDEFHSDKAPAADDADYEVPSTQHSPEEHAPMMELAPASQSTGDLDKTAKAFPSEHDQSGNLLEVVEADGAKQLVVRKDVRTKVTQRVNDYFSGTFAAAEAVCVDFGDYISSGKITAYAGKGIYKVKMEDGRDLDIPVASIFSANSANKLWE